MPRLTGAAYSLWDPAHGSANGFTDASPTGGNFAAVAQASTLSQTITGLKVGAIYSLSFAWAQIGEYPTGAGGTSGSFQVGLGSSYQNTPWIAVSSDGFSGWYNAVMSFTATASTETLSFISATNGILPMMLLANPQLIPEPAPLTVLAGGVATLLGLTQRRGLGCLRA